MNPDSCNDTADADNKGSQGVRTLTDAKAWLAKMAKDGAAGVQIKEPYRDLGGGLLIITASLVRGDGARVNIEVYCYDDRKPARVRADRFPLPVPGVN